MSFFIFFNLHPLDDSRAPFKQTISPFAEAISSQAHLDSFISLASIAEVQVDEAVAQIEENIRWMAAKAPEIGKWTASMKGTAINLKASVLTILALMFVMSVK